MSKGNKPAAIVMMILGVLCILYPLATAWIVNIVIGAAFIAGSASVFLNCPGCKDFWDKAMYFVLAMVYLVGGAFMLFHPLVGIAALTIVLGASFLIQGFFTLYYWSMVKTGRSFAFMAFLNGILAVALGVILLANVESGFWFIGLLVGINLIFTGSGLLMLGSGKKYI